MQNSVPGRPRRRWSSSFRLCWLVTFFLFISISSFALHLPLTFPPSFSFSFVCSFVLHFAAEKLPLPPPPLPSYALQVINLKSFANKQNALSLFHPL
jgi:hypothetical protein